MESARSIQCSSDLVKYTIPRLTSTPTLLNRRHPIDTRLDHSRHITHPSPLLSPPLLPATLGLGARSLRLVERLDRPVHHLKVPGVGARARGRLRKVRVVGGVVGGLLDHDVLLGLVLGLGGEEAAEGGAEGPGGEADDGRVLDGRLGDLGGLGSC